MSPLILECARAHPDSRELRRLCSLCPDWGGLVESALKQKLAPMVFWALNRACPEAVPPEAMAALRDCFQQSTKRNFLYVKELFRLLDLFGPAGIQAIPFKGPVLAWSLYETPGLRFLSDLDLLVSRRDVRRAIDLLTSNGYRQCDPGVDLRFLGDGGQMLFHRADVGFAVDLHWRIVAAQFNPLDVAKIRARLTPIDIAGRQTPAFCPEDLFAYLCVHGSMHEWSSLAALCDLDRLIDACRLDWEAILSRAAERRMLRIVSVGLCLAQELLGSNVPAEVSSRVHADAGAVALAASVRGRLRGGHVWTSRDTLLLRLRLIEGVGRKLRFFWYILQPTPADWKLLRIPESMFPVYYLARPVRLAWKWCVRPIFG